jgi:CTP:molybdopterin cytidylyltransferase MocA
MNSRSEAEPAIPDRLTVSLKTLSRLLDAHRSSVRRWLQDAKVHPLALSSRLNGAIRYRWDEVEKWIRSRPRVD